MKNVRNDLFAYFSANCSFNGKNDMVRICYVNCAKKVL